jgi:hypothetical protein
MNPSQKKVETMEAPRNRRFYGKMDCLSLFGPIIQVRKGGLWAKHMGLKRGIIGNTLVKHIENLKGTCWEQI